jgi:hypothetical protein
MTESSRRIPLADPLHRGAAELRGLAPPEDLLQKVHRRLHTEGPAVWRQPPLAARLAAALRERLHGWRGAALAAACAALLVLVVLPSDPFEPGPDEAAPRWSRMAGFVPVAGHEHWRRAAEAAPGQVWLVPAEMPRERLAVLGLPYDPARVGERVRAQLLVHASGDVLAVRVMQ